MRCFVSSYKVTYMFIGSKINRLKLLSANEKSSIGNTMLTLLVNIKRALNIGGH